MTTGCWTSPGCRIPPGDRPVRDEAGEVRARLLCLLAPLALVLAASLGPAGCAASSGPDDTFLDPDATDADDAPAGDARGDDAPIDTPDAGRDVADGSDAAAPPVAVFVENGLPVDVRYDGTPWTLGDGWLVGDGCSRFLHGGRRIGTGDFRVSVRMQVRNAEGAVFLFRGSNHLRFRDASGNMVLEGPLFPPDDAVNLGPSTVADDVPFTLELVREGTGLDLRLDGTSLYRTTLDDPDFGTVGLAPGLAVWLFGLCASEAVVSVSDFRVEGTTRPLGPAPGVTPVFQRGDDGYDTFRIPALVRGETSGSLLAFAEGRKDGEGDSGDIDLVLRRSPDGGVTWGALQVVANDGTNTCGNPVPIADRTTGTIWVLYTTNDGGLSEADINAGKGSRDAWATYTRNDGATWAAPVSISASVKPAGARWFATGPGHGIQLGGGRLVAPCNYTVGPQSADGVSCAIVSDDHGATWKAGGGVPGGYGDETTIAERPDGSLRMSFRSRYVASRRGVSTSTDGGDTWTEGAVDEAAVDPHCQGSLLQPANESWQIASGGQGILLLSNAASTQREFLTVHASLDGGATWPIAQWLYPGPSAYSDLVERADGTIGILYERGELSPYETIVFSAITPVWLLEPVFGTAGD